MANSVVVVAPKVIIANKIIHQACPKLSTRQVPVARKQRIMHQKPRPSCAILPFAKLLQDNFADLGGLVEFCIHAFEVRKKASNLLYQIRHLRHCIIKSTKRRWVLKLNPAKRRSGTSNPIS
jgi:hypothetical protein